MTIHSEPSDTFIELPEGCEPLEVAAGAPATADAGEQHEQPKEGGSPDEEDDEEHEDEQPEYEAEEPEDSRPPTPLQIRRETRNELIARDLAAGSTIAATARNHNVSTKTVQRIWQRPEFVARVRELQRERLSQTAGRLNDYYPRAAEQLIEISEDEWAKPQDKLKALDMIFRYGDRIVSVDLLGDDIDELENTARAYRKDKKDRA
jgi:hypothetical protein